MNPSSYPQVLAEETATNFGFTNYTWGPELVSRVDFSSGQPIYFAHDGQGSVRELTDTNGNVTDTYDYDAFATCSTRRAPLRTITSLPASSSIPT